MAAQLRDLTILQVAAGKNYTPRAKLPFHFTVNLHWSHEDQVVDFIYDASGASRDAFSSVGYPWILKAEPVRSKMATSATRQEWEIFSREKHLPIPTCYGYIVKSIAGKEIEFLLMDRIAFTLHDALVSLRSIDLDVVSVEVLKNLIMNPICTMAHLAAEKNIHLYDWHIWNVAFNDTKNPQVVLIDWQNNLQHDGTPTKSHMKQCFVAFYKYLDHIDDKHDKAQRARLPQFYIQWQPIIKSMEQACHSWWQGLHALPTKHDLANLDRKFTEICSSVVRMPTRSTPPPEQTNLPASLSNNVTDADYATSNLSGCSPRVPTTTNVSPTHSPTVEAPSSICGLSGKPAPTLSAGVEYITREVPLRPSVPTSCSTWPPTDLPRSLPACPEIVYRCELHEAMEEYPPALCQVVSVLTASGGTGRTAAISLGKTALEHLAHMSIEPRHGKFSPNTVLMAERMQNPGKLRKLDYNREDGNAMDLLFRIILAQINAHGYLGRCGNHVPRAAIDPLKFHGAQSARFSKACPRPFEQLSTDQQLACLRSFLFERFCTDRTGEHIVPRDWSNWKQADISWGDFYLEEREFDEVCHEVIEEFENSRHILRTRNTS
jgi:hypothetical protein